MSFEIKYDKNGMAAMSASAPQPNPEPKQEIEPAAAVIENLAPEDSSPQEPESVTAASESQSEEQVQRPIPAPQSDPKQSFKELRSQKEKAERERDYLMQKLQENEQQKQSKATPQEVVQSQDQDYEFTLGPDDLAEGKHLNKVAKHIKKLEDQLKQFHQQSAAMSTEAKLKAQYPDFDNVVTKDNIEMLRATYPEIASTIHSSQDLYAKAVSAYTMIKKLGIQPDAAPYQADVERAQKNAAKPRPLASVSPQQGASPLSKANAFADGLTDALKAELIREMNQSRKGY